jgi:hypothetical protein
VQLNLVDEDSRELVSAWLMTVAATSPAVMRSYDVDVPGRLSLVSSSSCACCVEGVGLAYHRSAEGRRWSLPFCSLCLAVRSLSVAPP